MNEKISQTVFKSPSIQIINNVNAKPVTDPLIIKKLLVDQIFSTVKWRESITYMEKDKIKVYENSKEFKFLSLVIFIIS